MKRNIKRISVLILLGLCMSLYSAVSMESATTNPNEKPLPKDKKSEGPLVVVEEYPKELTSTVKGKLDSLLESLNKRQYFNGTILVAKNNKIVYKNHVGLADLKAKTPLSEESAFQLASVSKQFTAAAIMLLQDQKKLNITDNVTKYFPDFPYTGVTIKNLLNHTSGLPGYFWIAEHKWKQSKAPLNSEMMNLMASARIGGFFRPGYNFDYSNTGYMVLASIVEKVSGMSFGDFLNARVFKPLEMKNSFVYCYQKDVLRANQLSGYELVGANRHTQIRFSVNDGVAGDKNVYTTAEDLYKWTLGLNSGKLISKESLDLMYTPGETISGRKIPYGFGFRLQNTEEEKRIYHYGRWNGFRTGLTNYVDDKLVVIVLEHTGFTDMSALNKKIKSIVNKNFPG